MVCAAMIRQAVTGSVWPIRCTRSIAWVCSAFVQESSASTTLEATWRLIPTPAAVERADDDRDVGVVDECVDRLLAGLRGLVAADEVWRMSRWRNLLGAVHHVEVLGEEDDLAGTARELGGVVGGELGLRLADAANHREDVVPCARLRAIGDLPLGHPADERVVDARPWSYRCVGPPAPPGSGRRGVRPGCARRRVRIDLPARPRARPEGRQSDVRGCRRRRRPCAAGRCRGR